MTQVRADVDADGPVEEPCSVLRRLAGSSEPVRAAQLKGWRQAFSAKGLDPTHHRCASGVLVRLFRKDGPLPTIHPPVGLRCAPCLAFAIPVAVLDLAQVDGDRAGPPTPGRLTPTARSMGQAPLRRRTTHPPAARRQRGAAPASTDQTQQGNDLVQAPAPAGMPVTLTRVLTAAQRIAIETSPSRVDPYET